MRIHRFFDDLYFRFTIFAQLVGVNRLRILSPERFFFIVYEKVLVIICLISSMLFVELHTLWAKMKLRRAISPLPIIIFEESV